MIKALFDTVYRLYPESKSHSDRLIFTSAFVAALTTPFVGLLWILLIVSELAWSEETSHNFIGHMDWILGGSFLVLYVWLLTRGHRMLGEGNIRIVIALGPVRYVVANALVSAFALYLSFLLI